MPRPLTTLSLFAVLALASGCAYFTPTPPLQPEPVERLEAADLPVPEKFALDRAKSHRHERSAYRQLKLTYRRDEYLGQERAQEFFLRHLPAQGWETVFVYGLDQRKLLFFKGDEECHVRIHEDFGDRFTQIVMEIQPRETPEGDLVARTSWND